MKLLNKLVFLINNSEIDSELKSKIIKMLNSIRKEYDYLILNSNFKIDTLQQQIDSLNKDADPIQIIYNSVSDIIDENPNLVDNLLLSLSALDEKTNIMQHIENALDDKNIEKKH